VIDARFAAALASATLLATGRAEAQRLSAIDTRPIANSRSDAAMEERGRIGFTLRDDAYDLKFVLRYPRDTSRWTGRLVIGVHGETGAVVRYGPDGREIGTHETQLDDMIGRHALDSNHAYASFERGVGGRDDALRVLYGFSSAMQERLKRAAGREPSQIYLVGWSTGGTLARYAVEDSPVQVHGAVIVAGVGGNPAWVTGVPHAPAVEVVGTGDPSVAGAVRAYRDRVRREAPRGRDLIRVYEVEGARHVSSDDDDVPSFELGKSQARREQYIGRVSYFAVVRTALDLLDRWAAGRTPPPPDQVVVPPGNVR
jgi:pimeloyl-ACP methyl ester carboxylesterase